jgi:hypothetical protein
MSVKRGSTILSMLQFQAILTEWSTHVSELRDSHGVLNFFTTDQLVLLAEQLSEVIYRKAELSVEASMLLALLARG